MTIQRSVAVRNARGNADATAIGASAKLSIRSGAPPSNCGSADTGTEIIRYSLPATWANTFSAGAVAAWLNSLPLTGAATGAAVPGHWRLYASDGVTCHKQGTITATGGGGDMTMDSVAATTVGQVVNVNT